MGKRRRTPIRHSVHPRDPRYTVSEYSRGRGWRRFVFGRDSPSFTMCLVDPAQARQDSALLWNKFINASDEEQTNILRNLDESIIRAERLIDSGAISGPDKVDDVIRVRKHLLTEKTRFDAEFHRQKQKNIAALEDPRKKAIPETDL